MKVFTDLKTPGVVDILIAVTDGLKGMPEALAAVCPATTLQTCIVYLIRNSLDYASWEGSPAPGSGAATDLHDAQCRHGAGRTRRP
jgi:transposase-like protein